MKIHQFEDKGLAHYSYAILSECQQELVLIDPARNPEPYYAYADEHKARIVGVIETHPHADFVSSHLEIHKKTGAIVYVHSMVGADYPHQSFDEGEVLKLGKITLKSLHTPGHSPDSISIVLEHDGKDKAVFTGDTLFVGDVGRPDLRENAGNQHSKKVELARQMYHSTRMKLMKLDDEVVVYPAHGAGTLCGKGLSEASKSTIGEEKDTNPALQTMKEEEFVKFLLAEQPFIPRYFGYNVDLNRHGAPDYKPSIEAVPRVGKNYQPKDGAQVIDGRPEQVFKKGHLPNAINIQEGNKFETWLGSILAPQEPFYLTAESEEVLNLLLAKTAKIGYEGQITGAFVMDTPKGITAPKLDLDHFKAHPDHYTIVDVRNGSEVYANPIFKHVLRIPLPELRESAHQIPQNKPIVVHCAGGYRSAAGSSLVSAALPEATVLDLGEAVHQFSS